VKAGLHFLIPIGVLIWCLMIEELSPALSAFWATACADRADGHAAPLVAVAAPAGSARPGCARPRDLREGLNDGARNMIGIAVATATAGIIVGAITLTGLGLR
jgi:TRAP-type uncharacterized transport system fused permease subunit